MATDIARITAAHPFELSMVVSQRVEAGWQELQSRDPRVFNGTLLRVIGKVDETATSVSVVPDIGYREVVGVRSYDDFLDWLPQAEQFQVLSAISFVTTSDGVTILRDRSTGDWEQSLELCGGFITADDTCYTIEEYIGARVADDLSIPQQMLMKVDKIGYVDFESICESMFVYSVTVDLSFADIIKKQQNFVEIPDGYSPESHAAYFNLPLHPPSKTVLEQYLSRVR